MTELQRITTEFIDSEDRIRLSGENAAGETVILWLTRRLLDRVLPHLCLWLERRIPTDAHYAAAARAELIQGFAQRAALAAMEPQAPVQGQAQSLACLVHSVNIARAEHGVMLTFKTATDDPVATLPLNDQPLRQWLNILHDQYATAGWPLAAWPEWMIEARSSHAQQHATVLH